jgi:hypothetical protein
VPFNFLRFPFCSMKDASQNPRKGGVREKRRSRHQFPFLPTTHLSSPAPLQLPQNGPRRVRQAAWLTSLPVSPLHHQLPARLSAPGIWPLTAESSSLKSGPVQSCGLGFYSRFSFFFSLLSFSSDDKLSKTLTNFQLLNLTRSSIHGTVEKKTRKPLPSARRGSPFPLPLSLSYISTHFF